MVAVVAVPARGAGFLRELERCWSAGEAVLPLDPRLPPDATDALLEALAPTHVLDADGHRRLRPGGLETEPGDALVVATSGTTGRPKGVLLTHDAVAASARATSARLGVDPGTDRWLACLPLAHVGGLSVLTRAIVTGTPVDVLDGFDAEEVDRSPATLVSLVATALRRIDAGRWRAVVLGGSAPPSDLPPNVVTTYGLTETGSGVVYDGRPLDGVEVRVVEGAIHLRGPMLTRGYRDGTSPLVDGWLRTGDVGELGADGRLTVHGRADDVVVTGGENVWPEPVERRLVEHPRIAAAAVVGRPDPEWGEVVVAVVEPVDGALPDLDEVRDWVSGPMPRWCAPRELVPAGRLPRTSLGKLRRRAVRDSLAPTDQ